MAFDDRAALPLSALLSQLLVAYTVEFDNAFEFGMAQSGPVVRLSLMILTDLVRFLADGELSVESLAEKALASKEAIAHGVGCLERWRILTVGTERAAKARRAGWGSGRGIGRATRVALTDIGVEAARIAAPLLEEIDGRWRKRFGARTFARLRRALEEIEEEIPLELPWAVPVGLQGAQSYPPKSEAAKVSLPLAALLARVLVAFRIGFDKASKTPLALCANAIRVLGEEPIPESELPRLTGCSAETAGVGWWLKPYVVEERAEGRRGRAVRLSERGLRAQGAYGKVCAGVERAWEERFGSEKARALREALELVRDPQRLAEGLAAPEGTVRSGAVRPALGRRSMGPAAVKRNREIAAQNAEFVRDPLGKLPHYPLWDMNRGFGP